MKAAVCRVFSLSNTCNSQDMFLVVLITVHIRARLLAFAALYCGVEFLLTAEAESVGEL